MNIRIMEFTTIRIMKWSQLSESWNCHDYHNHVIFMNIKIMEFSSMTESWNCHDHQNLGIIMNIAKNISIRKIIIMNIGNKIIIINTCIVKISKLLVLSYISVRNICRNIEIMEIDNNIKLWILASIFQS